MSKRNPDPTVELKVLPLDTIVPYWRNPRDNDLAVEKVADSIRLYGYQQPIVVDTNLTIIAGHTRYRALKHLGWTEAPVLVSDMDEAKAKEYRIIDNRTSEYATWNQDLILELKEFASPDTLDLFFPHIDLNTDFGTFQHSITAENLETAQRLLDAAHDATTPERSPFVDIACPHCHESFRVLRDEITKAP